MKFRVEFLLTLWALLVHSDAASQPHSLTTSQWRSHTATVWTSLPVTVFLMPVFRPVFVIRRVMFMLTVCDPLHLSLQLWWSQSSSRCSPCLFSRLWAGAVVRSLTVMYNNVPDEVDAFKAAQVCSGVCRCVVVCLDVCRYVHSNSGVFQRV